MSRHYDPTPEAAEAFLTALLALCEEHGIVPVSREEIVLSTEAKHTETVREIARMKVQDPEEWEFGDEYDDHLYIEITTAALRIDAIRRNMRQQGVNIMEKYIPF